MAGTPRRVRPSRMSRKSYLSKQLEDIHERIEACVAGVLAPTLEHHLRLRADRTRFQLDEHVKELAILADAEEETTTDMTPKEMEEMLIATLSELPHDQVQRIISRVAPHVRPQLEVVK